ncbi:ROK family glucokinase [Mobilitalea sibirica]|uniref:Glucokinase n=1 Tax=Mobilitalea sibirica TaxID=1462919 RepID=A0A8J7HCA7_9FIRM|nr:ROK family glucokinase [Mobilitalea sibirica]MBH1942556.1 ROK family glucokinase [Mobilitalea sibirica]
MEQLCFGVDIGGTAVKVGLFTTEGRLVEKWDFATRKTKEGKEILKDVADFIKEKIQILKLDMGSILGIGIGLPGPVKDNGEVLELPNMGLGHFNIEKEMQELIGLKVKAANDANIAALGEQWQGSGKGYHNMVLITLGTGVGGGVILKDAILAGSNGAGGEIGHMLVNYKEKDRCGCGKRGCLEQYASATGIVRMAKRSLSSNNKASALQNIDNISAKIVFDLAKEGDALAQDIVSEACRYLGIACANIAQVIDPEAFIIGGGVSKAGEVLTDQIKEYYEINVMDALKNKDFKLAVLGNDAGIYGGARLILASNG